jgi:hypothetical protein
MWNIKYGRKGERKYRPKGVEVTVFWDALPRQYLPD